MTAEPGPRPSFVVIGGGPAGLTAAYELTRCGIQPVVLERAQEVGGLARTKNYKGFYFDMGGHRFFTKSEQVEGLWREILLDDFLRRPRLSRIYYRKKLFHYPLRPFDALLKIGILEAFLASLSYLRWQVFPYRTEETFEQWVTNRFGKRTFEMFFKTYTEKVWGIPCSELKAEWAAQRIKDLSLKTVLLSFFLKPRRPIRTLIDEFDYPRLGPGMMWNAVKARIEERGGAVRLRSEVVQIRRCDSRIEGVVVEDNGHRNIVRGTHFISSMPITEFVQRLEPPPPKPVLEAAQALRYRDFLTVCLIVNRPELFPDNWIYIHDPEVRVGRIQNFKNWSPAMVPNPSKTSLGLEYFCNEGDELWGMPDAKLVELGMREIERIGLAHYDEIEDGCVFRVPKAYPVYDGGYRDHLERLKQFMSTLENCQTIGRNGLHRYNNQDHSMLTGIFAVRNAVLGERNDLWNVNADGDYHEEVAAEAEAALKEAWPLVLGKIDPLAAGVALGTVSGVALFLMTLILVLKGGPEVGPNLSLLNQYFPRYRVSAGGSLLGLAYAGLCGFLGGWTFAQATNIATFVHVALIRRRARRDYLRSLLEYI